MPDMSVPVAASRATGAVHAPRGADGRASRVDWLIDNAAAYDAVFDAIGRARRSVWISQLALDADCRVHQSVSPEKPPADMGEPLLVGAIVQASTERAVDVRVLLNASLLLDTARSLRAFVRRAGASGIRVRGVSRFPQLLHAKIVVVDQREAFLLGSPFVNGYWDDVAHRPVDSRRPARELGGRPLHDVTVRLTGPSWMTSPDCSRSSGTMSAAAQRPTMRSGSGGVMPRIPATGFASSARRRAGCCPHGPADTPRFSRPSSMA